MLRAIFQQKMEATRSVTDMRRLFLLIVYLFLAWHIPPSFSNAWYDETHVAMAKAAGYSKWFNSAGPETPSSVKWKTGKATTISSIIPEVPPLLPRW